MVASDHPSYIGDSYRLSISAAELVRGTQANLLELLARIPHPRRPARRNDEDPCCIRCEGSSFCVRAQAHRGASHLRCCAEPAEPTQGSNRPRKPPKQPCHRRGEHSHVVAIPSGIRRCWTVKCCPGIGEAANSREAIAVGGRSPSSSTSALLKHRFPVPHTHQLRRRTTYDLTTIVSPFTSIRTTCGSWTIASWHRCASSQLRASTNVVCSPSRVISDTRAKYERSGSAQMSSRGECSLSGRSPLEHGQDFPCQRSPP